MTRGVGRKALPEHFPLIVWVMVELMRDRREPGRKRDSERHACKRLSAHLSACFLGGREFEWETLRTYYKRFEREIKQPTLGERARTAERILADARFQRNMFGWEQSVWSLVIKPSALKAHGFDFFLGREFLTHELTHELNS